MYRRCWMLSVRFVISRNRNNLLEPKYRLFDLACKWILRRCLDHGHKKADVAYGVIEYVSLNMCHHFFSF